MRQYPIVFFFGMAIFFSYSNNNNAASTPVAGYDDNALTAVTADADSLKTFDFIAPVVEDIKTALRQPTPILLCRDSLNPQQKLAQIIALFDTVFTQSVREKDTKRPYRCEIFGVYPARESDMAYVKMPYQLQDCYRVEMYNYALNSTATAIADMPQ